MSKDAMWKIGWSEPTATGTPWWYVDGSGHPEPSTAAPRFDPPGGHYYGFQASSPTINSSPYFFWLGRDAEGFHARG